MSSRRRDWVSVSLPYRAGQGRPRKNRSWPCGKAAAKVSTPPRNPGKREKDVRATGLLLPFGLLVCLGGCLNIPEQVRSTSWRGLAPGPAADRNLIQMDVALLERPLGDAYINRELWSAVDEMVLDLERKAILQDNGLRVGQVVGMTPAGLHALLKSERWCLNPRRRLVPPGRKVMQFLSTSQARAEWHLVEQGRKVPVAFDQTRFALEVTPVLTEDGRIRLRFEPVVEHGQATLPFVPDPENSTWSLRVDRPTRRFSELGWEVVVNPNEYLVIGAWPDRKGTLGTAALVTGDGPHPTQRLLVLRSTRSDQASLGLPNLEDMARSGGPPPPLAVQATIGTVRSARP